MFKKPKRHVADMTLVQRMSAVHTNLHEPEVVGLLDAILAAIEHDSIYFHKCLVSAVKRHGRVAQLVEHETLNLGVGGSNPPASATDTPMVGEFRADYSALSPEEIAAPDAELDEQLIEGKK